MTALVALAVSGGGRAHAQPTCDPLYTLPEGYSYCDNGNGPSEVTWQPNVAVESQEATSRAEIVAVVRGGGFTSAAAATGMMNPEADPVTADGAFVVDETDVVMPSFSTEAALQFRFERHYVSSLSQVRGLLGQGWGSSYQEFIRDTVTNDWGQPEDCNGDVRLSTGLGFTRFRRHSTRPKDGGSVTVFEGAVADPVALEFHLPENEYRLVDASTGVTRVYRIVRGCTPAELEADPTCDRWSDGYYLAEIYNRSGSRVTVASEMIPGTPVRVRPREVVDTRGVSYLFTYSGDLLQCISMPLFGGDCQSSNPQGVLVRYEYGPGGVLSRVRDATGRVIDEYTYAAAPTAAIRQKRSPLLVFGTQPPLVAVPTEERRRECSRRCGLPPSAGLGEADVTFSWAPDRCWVGEGDTCGVGEFDGEYQHPYGLDPRAPTRAFCERMWNGDVDAIDEWCERARNGWCPFPTYPLDLVRECEDAVDRNGYCGFPGDPSFHYVGDRVDSNVSRAPYNDQGVCVDQCMAALGPSDGGELYGRLSELSYNLITVKNSQGKVVTQNEYGTVAYAASFDRVVGQTVNDGAATIALRYYDLDNPAVIVPDYVTEAVAMGADRVCACLTRDGDGRCVQYAEPEATSTTLARTAVVTTNAYGEGEVAFLNARRQRLKVVRLAAQASTWVAVETEVTVNEYDPSGRLVGSMDAAGVRECLDHDGAGNVRQTTRIASSRFAAPLAGTTFVTRNEYDAQGQLTDVHEDVGGGPGVHQPRRIHYARDATTGRVVAVEVHAAGLPAEVTTYTYDAVPPSPGLIVELPARITAPDGSYTQHLELDPYGAAPRKVRQFSRDHVLLGETETFYDSRTGLPTFGGKHGRQISQTTRDATGFPTTMTSTVWSVAGQHANQPALASTSITYAGRLAAQVLLSYWDPTAQRARTLTTTTQYDAFDRPFQVTEGEAGDQRTTCSHVGWDGRPLEIVSPEGDGVRYAYDFAGRRTTTTRGYLAPTTTGWAAGCAAQLAGRAPSGDVVESIEYEPGGFVKATTANGLRTAYRLDGFGRVLEARDPVGRLRWYGHDARGQLIWEAALTPGTTLPHARPTPRPYGEGGPVLQLTDYEYDAAGRRTRVVDWRMDETRVTPIITTTTYDVANNVVTTTVGARTTRTTTDALGRVTQQVLPDGSQTNRAFSFADNTITETIETNNPDAALPGGVQRRRATLDGLGLVTRIEDTTSTPAAVVHSELHDVLGRTVSSEDTGLSPQTFEYDVFGQLLVQRQATSSGEIRATSRYDRNGRRTEVSDWRSTTPAQYFTTTYHYDLLGRIDSVTDPEGRSTVTSFVGATTRPFEVHEPSGTVTTYAYHADGRLHFEWVAPADGATITRSFTHDELGRLRAVQDLRGDGPVPLLAHSFEYDSLGLVTRAGVQGIGYVAGPGFDVSHDADPDGAWTTTSFAGATVRRRRDPLGRTTQVELGSNPLAIYDHGARRGPGGPIAITFADGSREARGYDRRGQLTSLDLAAADGQWLARRTDSLAANGIALAREVSWASGAATAQVFDVDEAGRLVGENLLPAAAIQLPSGRDLVRADITPYLSAGTGWRHYTLDGEANWTSRTTGTGVSQILTAGSLNQYTSLGGGLPAPSYDAADNITTLPDPDGAAQFTYDAARHPVQMSRNGETVAAAYDYLGRRILETSSSGTTYFIWDGDEILAMGTSPTEPDEYTLRVAGDGLDTTVALLDHVGSQPSAVCNLVVTTDRRVIDVNRSAPGQAAAHGGYAADATLSSPPPGRCTGAQIVSTFADGDGFCAYPGEVVRSTAPVLCPPAHAPPPADAAVWNTVVLTSARTIDVRATAATGPESNGGLLARPYLQTSNSRCAQLGYGAMISVYANGEGFCAVDGEYVVSYTTYAAGGAVHGAGRAEPTQRFLHQWTDGSTLAVTDGSGLVEGNNYTAWGELLDETGAPRAASANRFLWKGALHDPITRTYSMRAREYAPSLGRFLSSDPIGQQGGLNVFAFGSGNPALRDPTGLEPQCVGVRVCTHYIGDVKQYDHVVGYEYRDSTTLRDRYPQFIHDAYAFTDVDLARTPDDYARLGGIFTRADEYHLQNLVEGRSDRYDTVERRTEFYQWANDVLKRRGFETRWPGGAAFAGRNLQRLFGFLPRLWGTATSRTADFLAKSQNAVFTDAFPKIGALLFGPVLRGREALEWDSRIVYEEQSHLQGAFASEECIACLQQWIDVVYQRDPVLRLIVTLSSDPVIPFDGNYLTVPDRWSWGLRNLGYDPRATPPPVQLEGPYTESARSVIRLWR